MKHSPLVRSGIFRKLKYAVVQQRFSNAALQKHLQ